jgi:hypothetical protein
MADINIGEFTETLNNKMDRDLSNREAQSIQTLFQQFLDWMLPDYAASINMTSPFTAPCAGIACWNNGGTSIPKVNGVQIAMAGNDSYNEGPALVFLRKGDVLIYGVDTGLQHFYPFKGVK